MAKQQLPWSKKAEGIKTPSLYGSHESMVVWADWYQPVVWAGLDVFAEEVVLEDNDGLYITSISRLDSGLADPHRYSHSDRDAFFDATLKEYDLTRESFLVKLAEFNEKYVWVDGEVQEKPDEEATD